MGRQPRVHDLKVAGHERWRSAAMDRMMRPDHGRAMFRIQEIDHCSIGIAAGTETRSPELQRFRA